MCCQMWDLVKSRIFIVEKVSSEFPIQNSLYSALTKLFLLGKVSYKILGYSFLIKKLRNYSKYSGSDSEELLGIKNDTIFALFFTFGRESTKVSNAEPVNQRSFFLHPIWSSQEFFEIAIIKHFKCCDKSCSSLPIYFNNHNIVSLHDSYTTT